MARRPSTSEGAKRKNGEAKYSPQSYTRRDASEHPDHCQTEYWGDCRSFGQPLELSRVFNEKRVGNPEETGVRPRHEKNEDLPETTFGFSGRSLRLAEADAVRLLQLSKLRIGWVECRIREHAEVARCYRCLGYGHGSRGCSNPDRKSACWRCSATGHLARGCKAPPRCLTCVRERLMPNLPGRASEVERQEMKFLQLNLGRE